MAMFVGIDLQLVLESGYRFFVRFRFVVRESEVEVETFLVRIPFRRECKLPPPLRGNPVAPHEAVRCCCDLPQLLSSSKSLQLSVFPLWQDRDAVDSAITPSALTSSDLP